MADAAGRGSPFEAVPQEVLENILQRVSGGSVNYDFVLVSQVCQQWNHTMRGLVTRHTVRQFLDFAMPYTLSAIAISLPLSIARSLRFPNLKFLCLRTFLVYSGSWSRVFELLGTNCPRLEALEIRWAEPNIGGDSLLVLHKSLPRLKSLSLPGRCLDAAALQLCLGQLTNLATLSLTGGDLSETMAGLSSCQALTLAGGGSWDRFASLPEPLSVEGVMITRPEPSKPNVVQLASLSVSMPCPGLGYPNFDVDGLFCLRELTLSDIGAVGLGSCRLLKKLHLDFITKSSWEAIGQMELLEELVGELAEEVTGKDLQRLANLPRLKTLEVIPSEDLVEQMEDCSAVLLRALADFPAANQLQRLLYPLHWHEFDAVHLSSLVKLSELSFRGKRYCNLCRNSSGELSSTITRLQTLKRMDLSLCHGLRSIACADVLTRLEVLRVHNCPQLCTIDIPATSRFAHISGNCDTPASTIVTLSPSLTSLDLSHMPVDALPPFSHAPHLRSLKLVYLASLSALPNFDPLQSLVTLEFGSLNMLRCVPPLNQLLSLLHLYIVDCYRLEELPAMPLSLVRLRVQSCPRVPSLPSAPLQCHSRSQLKILELLGCEALTVVNDLTEQHPHLEHVVLKDCPRVCRRAAARKLQETTRTTNDGRLFHLFHTGEP